MVSNFLGKKLYLVLLMRYFCNDIHEKGSVHSNIFLDTFTSYQKLQMHLQAMNHHESIQLDSYQEQRRETITP